MRDSSEPETESFVDNAPGHAMDFWSRLIGGIGSSPATKPSTAHDPQRRLARFKKTYSELLQVWRSTPTVAAPASNIELVLVDLQRLTSVLQEESRTPVPHPCLSFASQEKLYLTIAEIASVCRNEAIIREAILAFSTLIDSEEEEFLVDNTFAGSLMGFMEGIAGSGSMVVGVETDGEIVELLFGIAAKIRLQPEILPMWFTTKTGYSNGTGLAITDGSTELGMTGKGGAIAEGITRQEDFPLFYLLIGYVHHEGRVGDFARTGLLYLIESASTSVELETWLVESDLATLMASGLGALYSQLSRKLVVSYADQDLPAILALSDYSGPRLKLDAESSTSPDFLTHLGTFLSYLVFWQDVLEHCKSAEVKQTLLDHFQVLFLEQLLYPSLLESSDIDGGSSVAVLTYLGRILDSLDHPELLHLILHYLLALPEQMSPKSFSTSHSPKAARRRQSLDLLTQSVHGEDAPTPALFNLVDLVLASLLSHNQQTITATLRLLSVILRKHHPYAISTLFRTTPRTLSRSMRTIGAHDKEMDIIFGWVAMIGGEDDFDQSYESHVFDSLNRLEAHPCSAPLLAVKTTGSATAATRKTSFPNISTILGSNAGAEPRPVYHHRLTSEDPLLQSLLRVLRTFFVNAVETNLSLTETIVELASCGFLSLEGWLLTEPAFYEYPDHEDGDASPRDPPSWSPEQSPPLLTALQLLITQLQFFRHSIPNFDAHLQERKEAFQVSEELKEALSSPPTRALPIPSTKSVTSSPLLKPTPQKSVGGDPTHTSRLILSETLSSRPNTPTRSSSPLRGRQPHPGTPTPAPISKLQNLNPSLIRSPAPASPALRGGGGERTFSPTPPSTTPQLDSSPPSYPARATTTNAAVLRRVVTLPAPQPQAPPSTLSPTASAMERVASSDLSEGGSSRSASQTREERERQEKVTVSHLLTNVVVLQEFLLELAALVQGRVGLFGELRFV